MTTTPGEPISDPGVQPDVNPVDPIAPGEDPGVPPEPGPQTEPATA